MRQSQDKMLSDGDIPDYVCCIVTESVWTWFLTTIFSLLLFGIGTLKYCKKYLGSEKFAAKNKRLLASQLVEYGRQAKSVLRVTPVRDSEFLRYCAQRRKHSAIIDKLEFSNTLKFDDIKRNNPHLSKHLSPSLKYLTSANWIVGLTSDDRNWIVTDGPQEKTVVDFWLTIWEQNCPVVVMLSKTFEIVKMVCVQYWPNSPGTDFQQVYGALTVTLIKEHSFAHYRIRHIQVEHTTGEIREVVLFQYIDWPATAHPDTTSLLHFRRRVHEHLDSQSCNKPALIHCQTSKRRSGTFLAIEFALTQREKTDTIDIFGSVRWLRSQNPGLISSPEQYHFIYELVEDCILCSDTRIPCSLNDQDEDEKLLTGISVASIPYEEEYEKLCSLPRRLKMGDCAAGHRGDNRHKNRNVLIVPPDEWRPYLITFQSNNNGDYINAAFIDGFKMEKEFIATEWPLAHTVANFWSMIYDHDVAAIVVLNCPPSKLLDMKNFSDFWPQANQDNCRKSVSDDWVKHFGPVFSVEALSKEDKLSGDLGIWQLKVCKREIAPHKKPRAEELDDKNLNNITSLSNLLMGKIAPSKVVKLIQLRKSWPQNQSTPDCATPLLHVIEEVENWRAFKRANPRNKRGETEERVALVSCDGISRIGLYCTAVHSIEKALHMGHYDVFQSAKSVRRSRPELIQCVDEYKFCYEVVQSFIDLNTSSIES